MYRIPFADNVPAGEKPTLTQMETHGQETHYYELRYCAVFATSLAAARHIQGEWRADGSPLR